MFKKVTQFLNSLFSEKNTHQIQSSMEIEIGNQIYFYFMGAENVVVSIHKDLGGWGKMYFSKSRGGGSFTPFLKVCLYRKW